MKSKLLIGFLIASALSGAAWAASIVNVDQHGLSFNTAQLTVKRGDIVNFTNNDNTSHNILITGEGITLNSGLQQPGVSFKAPMVKPGAYQVICGIHPKMQMTLNVQ